MSTASAALADAARHDLVAAIADDSAGIVRLHGDQAGFVSEIGTNVTLA
jgi:hypothetical protein